MYYAFASLMYGTVQSVEILKIERCQRALIMIKISTTQIDYSTREAVIVAYSSYLTHTTKVLYSNYSATLEKSLTDVCLGLSV